MKKLTIVLLTFVLISSCVTYKTDCIYQGDKPFVTEYKQTKIFSNQINGVTIYRLDLPFKITLWDAGALRDIDGIINVTRSKDVRYSVYYSTCEISDTISIQSKIEHYVHFRAKAQMKGWLTVSNL